MTIKPAEIEGMDAALEYAARLIEETSFLDYRGALAKKKRDREDAQLRYTTIQETRKEMAGLIRAFIGRPDLSPVVILRRIQAHPARHDMFLRDAWPLAWKGLCNIHCTIKCNSNTIPPETQYRIELTEKGLALIAEGAAHD